MPQEPSDWESTGRDPDFKKLMAAKVRFIVPATIFFIAYYFALPILVGYAPELMATRAIGPVNISSVFALSQFCMACLIAYLYVRAANRFDRMAAEVLADLGNRKQRG